MKLTIKQPPNQGPDLEFDTKYDQLLGNLITSINQLRSPDKQISKLYNMHGKEMPITLRIRGDITLFSYQIQVTD